MDITEQKALLRSEIRTLRRSVSDGERKNASLAVAEKLLSLKGILDAEYVLAYMPMKYELDILPTVKELSALGKKVVFPLCIENGGLKLYIPSKGNGFTVGAYGILEPDVRTAEEVPYERIDAVILPAIGFDRSLSRLGQGGGYYDRLLSKVGCFTVAVGFDCQLVDRVPTEPTDRRVDAIVTPKELILAQI